MKWKLKRNSESKKVAGVSDIVSKLLAFRIDTKNEKQIKRFLNPDLSCLSDPKKIKSLELGCQKISEVIRNNGNIKIHGDYDADGITSAVVMAKSLKALGANFSTWLPHRVLDGYGMSDRFVSKAIEEKPDLIITVDCGVSEAEKISRLKDAGIDVVVTDHHEVPDSGIPEEALVVIDPKRKDETSDFRDLAGVGVAFKVCCELLRTNKERLEDEDWRKQAQSLIPYVAVGTVADVMPLIDENRIIVSAGIKMIQENLIDVGLRGLIQAANLEINRITSRDIGFMIAPRINSAGRMDDPSVAYRCFCCEDKTAASQLDMYNERRKEVSEEVFAQAELQLAEFQDDSVILVAQTNWHEGVLGIVAGKLAEKYHKPAIVLTITKDKAKGSGRSIEGVNLHKVVSSATDVLESFGGHEQALGLSVKTSKINKLRSLLNKGILQLDLSLVSDEPVVEIDSFVDLGDIDDYFLNEINKLEPFGLKNVEPILACKGVYIADMRVIGKGGRHFSATAIKSGNSCRIICFNAGDLINLVEDNPDSKFDLAFSPSFNTYNGATSIQLMIKDIKVS